MLNKNSRGFTLLEILLVVGIIAILAGIVIIAINPSKQLASARNTQRISDLRQVYNAMEQYYIDHNVYPATLPSSLTEICDTGTGEWGTHGVDCVTPGLIDLSKLVPTYIVAIPQDPQGPIAFFDKLISIALAATNGNGYEIMADSNNKIALNAPKAESGVTITVGPVVVGNVSSCDATCQSLRVGLVGYYPLNIDTNDYSTTTNPNNGTNVGATTTSGIVSGAYQFNGSSNYIQAHSVASGGLFGNVFTVSAWGKESAWGSWNTIFGAGEDTAVDYYMQVTFNPTSKKFIAQTQGHGAGVNEVQSLSTYDSDTNWHHFVLVVDTDSHIAGFYIDGVNQGTSSTYTRDLSTFNKFYIGAVNYGGPIANWTGKIDEVAVWSRALSDQEVTDLNNSGVGKSLMP